MNISNNQFLSIEQPGTVSEAAEENPAGKDQRGVQL